MTTKTYYFSGTVKWAKRAKDRKYDNYTINLYPDANTKAKIKESGIQSIAKTDTDGLYYVFRRPDWKIIKDEKVTFGPPSFFLLKDGKPEAYDGIVGNGSKGTVKVVVYDIPSRGSKGCRYEALMVEDLVEYVPPESTPSASSGAQTPPPF